MLNAQLSTLATLHKEKRDSESQAAVLILAIKLFRQLRLICRGQFLFVTQTSSSPLPRFNVVKNHQTTFCNLPQRELNIEWVGEGV